jgi:lipopolysaccharide export system permease protein
MNILARYISIIVINTVLVVLLVLMGLELLVSFIGQLSDIGTGNYTLWAAVKYILLDMPAQLYVFFPMAGLVGSLLGLGVLASQSELIVMRAAGYSTKQIAASVLKAAFVLMIVAMILGEVVAPFCENYANVSKTLAKSSGQALSTTRGLWIREGDNFIHVDTVINKRHLQGVTTYVLNKKNELTTAFTATKADFRNNQWELTDVKQSIITPTKIITKNIPTLQWNVKLDPTLLSISDKEPNGMSLPKLYSYINYLHDNGLRALNYQLDFWKRIMQPLATVVMIFLAVPFVFGSMRSMTVGVRILLGVTIGFCFYIFNQFVGSFSLLYQVPGYIAATIPTLVFMIIGFVLLARAR